MSHPVYYASDKAAFENFLQQQRHRRMVLLADACSNGYCLSPLIHDFPLLQLSDRIIVPQGEANKNIDTCMLIWQRLTEIGADRNTLLLNTGGGMVCDIGGFAASVYKRGIEFVNIPTTLLAMCDASLGGKTGIDFQGIKNQLGSFKEPLAVYIDPHFLRTLDERKLKSGIAEMVKHDMLQGGEHWKLTCESETKDFYDLERIRQSVSFKQVITEADPMDEGIRKQLNLGHSIGHAIESYSMHSANPLLHGEAIIYGLHYELLLSKNILGLETNVVQEFASMRQRIFPELQAVYTQDMLMPFLLHDKKNNDGIRMSLLRKAGECETGVLVNVENLQEVFST